ncbi:MAG: hypothetical protein K5697_13705 [Lachnospiraceae bacterium]|nr:hypothetical protein [Lachnospiraceae bacterium]
MKLRRAAVLFLSAVMVFAAVGCGEDKEEDRRRKDREEDEYEDGYDEEDDNDGGLFGGVDDGGFSDGDDDTINEDDGKAGNWQVIDWGDDDSDEDCIPTKTEVDTSIDPDDPCAWLYYCWKDVDNDVFEVGLDFFPNGRWWRYSDGGMDEGGTFDYDGGEIVTLHYGGDESEDMVFTLQDDGRLLDPYGDHYAIIGNISEETMQNEMSEGPDPYFEPLQNFYGRWLFTEYESYYDIYPDGTWEYTKKPDEGIYATGTYIVVGNSQRTTIYAQCEEYDDDELDIHMEGNKLIMHDIDNDELKRILKYY